MDGRPETWRIDRAHAIATLADHAGPLGPFRDLDEYEAARHAWLSRLTPMDLDVLLGLLTERPAAPERGNTTWEAFELELTHAIVAACRADPDGALAELGPLLAHAGARPAVIDAIGTLELVRGLEWLAPLVDDTTMDDDTQIRLADALGDIGGPAALRMLERLRARATGSAALRDEIDIAIDRIARN